MSVPEPGVAGVGAADDTEVSLWAYVDTLRRYRQVIVGAALAISAIFVIGTVAMLLILPTERVASIEFRLLFDGAAQGQYPNKTPFSPAEIVGPPVITEVFRANDLQLYGTYESFKNALFIEQSNPKLDQLSYEYQGKLSDARITAVDRSRIEAEFAQKRAALTDPEFSLSLRRSEHFKTLPVDLTQKVLSETLATWAVQAERSGAMKYQLPILSSAVLSRQSFDDEDYLIAAELLRARATRVVATLAELEKVPGALTLRTSKDNVSLAEIRATIEDTLRFDLEPLVGIIKSQGITKNARLLTLYASMQVSQLRLERQVMEGRARAVQNALADYVGQRGSRQASDARSAPAWTPSSLFSQPVLDQLLEISSATQKSDLEYRQKLTEQMILQNNQIASLDRDLGYYEDIVKSVQGIGSRPAGSPELVELINSRSRAIFETIAKATDQISDAYQELSARNLNPVARLFAITGPFSQRAERALSFRSVGLSLALGLMLTLIGASAGCLIYDAMKRGSAA